MRRSTLLLLLPLAAGCASTGRPVPATTASVPSPAPSPAAGTAHAFPSRYVPLPSTPVFIHHATVLTAEGERIEDGAVLMRDGRIEAVGASLTAPPDATVVDARGRWVTPGIIDAHSHLGVYPAPAVQAHSDGNEVTDPITPQVSAEHSLWPQDPQFPLALAGGVTSLLVLPGSANLIGGLGVTVKNVPGRSAMDMKFPGAPYALKMACGENPKRFYGTTKGRAPSTRMGNVAVMRKAWAEAREYRRNWETYREKLASADKTAVMPDRDLGREHLASVLDGDVLVQNHCYRADEMLVMLDVAREFGFRITAFHHAVEGYKIADVLAAEGVCAAMWADWWGFKMEALDGIRENVAFVDEAPGSCAIVHSDSATGIQRLNQEAAKAMAAGNRAGLRLKEEDAIRWITLNAARALGIADRTGSLAPGKMADVVVWSGNPFSVYSRAEKVFVDGALAYDRADAAHQPHTDFELGLTDVEEPR